MAKPKKRYVVCIKVRSTACFEVEAVNRNAAMLKPPDEIRKGRVISYREDVEVTDAMEITDV